MLKKTTILALSCFALALTLVGCNRDNDRQGTQPAQQTAPAQTQTPSNGSATAPSNSTNSQ